MGIVNIHEMTLWVFWKFMRWRHWYFEYSRSDVMEIFRSWRHGYFEMHIQNYTTSFEYSKYPWHHFKNIPKYPWRQLLNIPMTSLVNIQNTNDVTSWIFKNSSMGNLNIRMLTSWVIWKFMGWCNCSFEYSWSNLSIHEVRSTVI